MSGFCVMGERARNTVILLVCLVVIGITVAGISVAAVTVVNRVLAAIQDG